jgi:hypothetical protein
MLYDFFWIIPRRLKFICQNIKFRSRGITQKKSYNIIRLSCNLNRSCTERFNTASQESQLRHSLELYTDKEQVARHHQCTIFFGKSEMRTGYSCTTCLRHVCPHSIRDTLPSRCLVNYKQPATENNENCLIIS